MKTAQGLRRYLYEFIVHDAVRQTREATGSIIPISQAKLIRRRVDEYLAEEETSLADPALSIPPFLAALDRSLTETVPGAQPLFGDHTSGDPNYRLLQARFMHRVGLGQGASASPALPITPYDPEWSERATVKKAGTALTFVPDQTINRVADGETARLSAPECGSMMLWTLDGDGKAVEAGRAMTPEDACGLTALMDKMSASEYQEVRQWVIDGGRDPHTGRIDRNRFMRPAALARSVAMLEELQSQGIGYEVLRDQNPGQIKARISGTSMEIRLTELREREDYAGARIYDNGLVVRYSTNHKIGQGRTAVYSPTPAEAVDLLRFAQGRPIQRQDRPGLTVGEPGTKHTEMLRRVRGGPIEPTEIEDSYHIGKVSMFVVKDYRLPGERNRDGSKVMLRRDATDRGLPEYFVDAEAAEKYLMEAVGSARENLAAALDVDGIIGEHGKRHAAASVSGTVLDEPPEFSSDAEIAAIQRSYWDVLTGRKRYLLRPGATEEMFAERLGTIGEFQAEESGIEAYLGNLVYSGSAAEKVRAHADEVLNEIVGTWEPELRDFDGAFVEQRFDPMRVARYMSSPTGQWSNLDNLASALRRAKVGPAEMMGAGFQANRFKDRLVRFDAGTAVPIEGHGSEFIRRIGATVQASIERNAAKVTEVLIDDQGVISWSAEKAKRDGSMTEVSGEIGQVFDIGEHGEIVTRFASGENALIVPGYEARIAAQIAGETKTVEERTLLRGYEQAMTERIEYQLAGDLLSGRSEVGEGACLNGVYSQLYGTKHPVDFIEQNLVYDIDNLEAGGRIDPWTASILATEARRVRYSNDIKAGSTVYAEHRAQSQQTDPAEDNHFDAWRLTGGRNMTVLTGTDQNGVQAPAGYFDPVMTGGATNQGIVRYLTEDAEVGRDGRITPGDPNTVTGSRTPLMGRDELQTLRFDPFDRQQMTASTLMQSSSITEPTGTAMMTFGGWTADDPIVVSREFAEANRIRGARGQLRPLAVGDKISDLHGNKGVVSLVVDRDMDLNEARAQGLGNEVAWFQANPEMNVVMSPFSLISRRNAGSARELMSGQTIDLLSPAFKDEEATSGGLGWMRFVVTHMAVDEKTKIYDDEAVLAGRGRKASSQLAWALGAQGCSAIMTEFYGGNTGAEANLREYMLSVGLDMEADGTLRVVGRAADNAGLSHEAIDERPRRRLIQMPELVYTAKGGLNTTAMKKAFGELIGDRGGDLEIPFPLTYPTGEQTEAVTASSWRLPVLSSHLRSGQEFEDGSTVTHDYTKRYLDIHEQACRYRSMREKLNRGSRSQQERQALVEDMSKAARHAQRKFESITADLERRVFSGKKNAFKTGLMSSRLPDSATAVWTADPRLDIDQVAMGPAMAKQLGFDEGDHALIWRDPVLRDAGLRYLRVTIDERLTGVAINPVMDACFDGDFDGDAVAVVKLHSATAKREAMARLSVPANLLDTGVVRERGTHPLAMQVSLDTQVALSRSPALRQEFDALSGEANLIRQGMDAEDAQATRARQDGVTKKLSDFYRSAQRGEYGTALTFSDREAHLRSVRESCVDTGAKGNEKKLADYARYLGKDGKPGITQADQEASMFATAIKAHGTGLGGSYSQRAVRALRNVDLKAVLEVTYPVTQSILQAKHDAAEARHKYEMLQGPGRELWRGRKLEHLGPGQWQTEFDEGEPVQAAKEEWVEQFIDFYLAKDGFGVKVNPEYVSRVAEALADPRSGLVRNLEDDPSLAGSLMDRMAYGGTLQDLIAAAGNHENLFDGEKNAQFASKVTRRARARVDALLAGVGMDPADPGGLYPEEPVIEEALVKPDVMADDHGGAQTRGARRHSAHAVTAGISARPRGRTYAPSITFDTTGGNDFEMGG